MGITQTITRAAQLVEKLEIELFGAGSTGVAQIVIELESLGYDVRVAVDHQSEAIGLGASSNGHHNGSRMEQILSNARNAAATSKKGKGGGQQAYWNKVHALAKRHGVSTAEAREMYASKK